MSTPGELEGSGSDASIGIPAGTAIGPFRIVRLIGRGGMAAVYEAHDVRLDRAVALKILLGQSLDDEEFEQRFVHEAQIAARLEHPNIVPIYSAGLDEGVAWMSMRLLPRGTLGSRLKDHALTAGEVVRILRDVAGALDYAHSHGVVHRDVKATNILLDASDGACVADFGLAYLLEGGLGLTRTGVLSGTPSYMAPERALGKPVDHRSDIYSLGILAYEMFCGHAPFTGESAMAVLMKHVMEPLPAPPAGVMSAATRAVIQKAAAKAPEDRWGSAGAFATALQESLDAAHGGSSVLAATRRSHSLSRVWWAGAGVAVLAAGIAGLVARAPQTAPPTSSVSQPAPPTVSVSQTARAADISIPDAAVLPAAAARVDANPPRRPGTIAATPRIQAAAPMPIQAVPPSADDTGGLRDDPSRQVAVASPAVAPAEASAPRPIVANAPDPPSPAVADAEVVTSPVRTRTVVPDYPQVARAAQLEGDVILQATVEANGTVSAVTVLKSVHPLLDEAARKAVRQYSYTPAQRNGVPRAADVRITVSFRLR